VSLTWQKPDVVAGLGTGSLRGTQCTVYGANLVVAFPTRSGGSVDAPNSSVQFLDRISKRTVFLEDSEHRVGHRYWGVASIGEVLGLLRSSSGCIAGCHDLLRRTRPQL